MRPRCPGCLPRRRSCPGRVKVNSAAGARAAGRRPSQLGRPGPERCSRRIRRRAWGRDHPGGNVPQPVAQGLALGHRQRTVQQVCLGPAGEGLGRPGPARARRCCGASGQGGGWPGRWPWRRGCGPRRCALAVPQLQSGKVMVGLVGEEDLEAVAIVVGEAQLGAGMGVLSARRSPGCRPARCAG